MTGEADIFSSPEVLVEVEEQVPEALKALLTAETEEELRIAAARIYFGGYGQGVLSTYSDKDVAAPEIPVNGNRRKSRNKEK